MNFLLSICVVKNLFPIQKASNDIWTYVNDIWRNIDSQIRLFADDCIIYRKVVNNQDIDKLQTDLDKLRDWAVENGMKINPSKNRALSFTRARVKDPLNYTLRDQKIPEDSSC